MYRLTAYLISYSLLFATSAQTPDPMFVYQAAATRINDLVHTKLEVKFDYAKQYLYGKATITLHPHGYPTDSLTLDAKGMDIHSLSISRNGNLSPLSFRNNGEKLFIHLDKSYRNNEDYTVYIDYTAKPNELKVKGSEAITDAKGLYFINPLGLEKNKPTQIWTQGETESNSAWFPTIDKPNQKTTEEILMTVPAKFVTLSNGRLDSQKMNSDSTRTDDWKMELPHAPYLFFMGVGDYAIVKDSYHGKDVNYYVEKDYAPVAKQIFGLTPEMIGFYSRILNYEFPWVKYDQMTARDYVSGAMENTTATLHTDALQQDARQLLDGNHYEDYIAHELFHQWFGDLVTAESWSNLTVNESFANFSETIWAEYKHGKDAGDATNYSDILKYLADSTNPSKDLVRYHYADKEAVFDMVTYSKGGRILNMLRNYLGDSVFFKSLNLYLTTNQFKAAEADNLRLAFETVTGQDLHWYWNQWYYGSGHPILSIHYDYRDAAKKVVVRIEQTQATGKIFRAPIAIDVYEKGKKTRHREWLSNAIDSFEYSYVQRPDLVNVDGDKILLCEKKDNKTLENFIYQYANAGLYLDRREAIDFCATRQDAPNALALLKKAMKDRYFELREYTLDQLNLQKPAVRAMVEPVLVDLAKNDPMRTVQAKAIDLLGTYKKSQYKPLFLQKVRDSSYSVAGSALGALDSLDDAAALTLANEFSSSPAKGNLLASMSDIYIKNGDFSHFDVVIEGFSNMEMSEHKLDNMVQIALSLLKIDNSEQVKKAIDAIAHFRNHAPLRTDEKKELTEMINDKLLTPLADRKAEAGLKDQSDYIRTKLK